MTIHYTKGEEWANTLSHGVGILIGIAGGGYLLLTAMKSGNPWATGGMWLYLFGMLSSYISSTWYHASKPSPHREVLRKFDHASIYLHIAGSYSPIMLIALREADYWGWGILSFVWLCALAGIILCFCNLKEHSIVAIDKNDVNLQPGNNLLYSHGMQHFCRFQAALPTCASRFYLLVNR